MKAVDRRLRRPEDRFGPAVETLAGATAAHGGRSSAGGSGEGRTLRTRAHESPGCRTDVSVGNIAGGVNPPSYPYPYLRPVSP